VIDVEEVGTALKRDPEAVQMLRGERGAQGIQGDPGRAGDPGKDGMHGRDGASVTPEQLRAAVDASFTKWVVDFERIATDRQRAAIESIPEPRDGRDGKDGRNGFGLDDFEFKTSSPDGGRTIEFELAAGGRTQVSHHRTAAMIYRGIYDAQRAYQEGDTLTWGGSVWHVQRDNPQGKPGTSPDFKLAVKRGDSVK
jgi:hypothetical protein